MLNVFYKHNLELNPLIIKLNLMEHKPKGIVILSGGMDSTTMVYMYSNQYNVIALSFNYGQRHIKEIEAAEQTAKPEVLTRIESPIIRVAEFPTITLRGVGVERFPERFFE